jgi:tRNA U34 5-carboxymethylaminomethyl modifying GTPase MnmE/TrmE
MNSEEIGWLLLREKIIAKELPGQPTNQEQANQLSAKVKQIHEAKQSFLNSRINLLEELLEDLELPLDYHADDNDFEKMAKIKKMMQETEYELIAARNGWDCHSEWLKKWKKDHPNNYV